LFLLFGKGLKPDTCSIYFFGLRAISLIVSFKFKEWVQQGIRSERKIDNAEEVVRTGEPIIFASTVLFLILGGVYLYRSNRKKK